MSTITTRAGKGSPLTNTEMDNNLTNLNTDKLQSGDTAASLTITSADINGGTIDGTTIGATTPSTAAFSETVISASGSTTALRVTNTGTGNSLLIEDSSNPDSTPFVVDNAGLVGIGTAAPTTKLTISANTALPSAGAQTNTNLWIVGADTASNNLLFDTFGNNSGITQRRANGTSALPTAVLSADLMGAIGVRGYGATGYTATSKAQMLMYASENWSDTAQGTYIAFTTTANTTTTTAEKMRIDNAGNVGIGGSAGSTFKLDVIGNSSSAAVQLRAINNDTSGTSASSLVAQNGSGTTVLLQTYGTDAILNVSSNNPLAFRTNNTERMRIDTSGVVTISGDLAVNGATSADITTTTTTASLFNATATTVNIGSAATTISIGDTLHSGTTTVQHDLYVHGSITFGAGASSLSATTISIDDTLISLADANTADILDIGFYAGYQPASTALHTGLVRDASDSVWKLFSGISAQPTTTVDFTGATYAPLRIGALTATDGTFSGVITASAGTVTAPAITTTGDTNTGIYFPTADTIAFTEGGEEVMRIGSNGSLGIGTTSPIINTTTFANTNDPVINGDGGYFGGGLYFDTVWKNTVASQGGWAIRNSGGILTLYTGAANGAVGSTITTDERMRIDGAGNVGIGTTSPSGFGKFAVVGVSGTPIINYGDGTVSGTAGYIVSTIGYSGTRSNHATGFLTNDVERGRFLAGGQLLVTGGSSTSLSATPGSVGNSTVYARLGMTAVNDTTTLGYFQSYNSNAATDLKTWRQGGQNDGSYIFQTVNDAYNSSTTRLTVSATGALTATGDITAFSDQRLKTNITTIDNALNKVTQLRGVTFIKDDKPGLGVIAQEIQKVFPELVHEANDEMKTLSVAYGNIVGVLIEAIKELKAEIDELKGK
jgi:hypothetical protein